MVSEYRRSPQRMLFRSAYTVHETGEGRRLPRRRAPVFTIYKIYISFILRLIFGFCWVFAGFLPGYCSYSLVPITQTKLAACTRYLATTQGVAVYIHLLEYLVKRAVEAHLRLDCECCAGCVVTNNTAIAKNHYLHCLGCLWGYAIIAPIKTQVIAIAHIKIIAATNMRPATFRIFMASSLVRNNILVLLRLHRYS